MRNRIEVCQIATLALAFLAATSAPAQQATTALAGLTPNQIHNGTAKLAGHYTSSQNLRLVIGLQHPHLAEEEEFLKELSTKGSPNFQKFLTADQWNSRFGPSAADEQVVVDWAVSQGLTVSNRFANRLLVDVEGPVATIEKAFGVTINSYQVGPRTAFSNDRDPVIPAAMGNIIHSIGGLNSIQVFRPSSKTLPEPAFADYVAGPARAVAGSGGASATAKRPAKSKGAKSDITNGAYDPTDIYSSQAYDVQALYNQGHCCNPLGNSGITPPSSSIAIATAGTQSGSDLAGFQTSYPYLAYHYQQFYIDGTPSCCDGEGTLDFDWSTAWSNSFGGYQNTAMIYLYDGVNNQFSTFTDVYNQILSDQKAKVFSTSWGCEETACTPNSVMDTDHGIFNSMIGQGMTLVAASGDQGATAGCGDKVAVQYPASDPNIVGAGGNTLLLDGNSNYYSETAWSGGPDGCGSNDGGSTGGLSSYYSEPSYQNGLSDPFKLRMVPDIALNADWYNSPQNFYFGGSLSGNGGTSIVAPSIAGFFAQTNAYLDYVATINGGCYGTSTCSPIGNGNWYLYYFGENTNYAPHYPFYDITSGCNNNDITSEYNTGYFCAGTGYDLVTGWGSFNALQLTRAITTYRAGDFVAPSASFSGYTQPIVNHWYNTDQAVQWTVSDAGQTGLPATGVGGFSQSWDNYIYDSFSETTPGSGDSFYSGPQFPNATYGYLDVSSAGQGCHTVQVRSWDNSGFSGYQTYGPVCYDTVPPVSTITLNGTQSSGVYVSSVSISVAATDASSGVKTIYYKLDGGSYTVYSSAINVSTQGTHSIYSYSVDVAGNTETAHGVSFTIESPTTTTVSASANPSVFSLSLTLTAKVAPSFGAAATGAVTFKDGTTALGNGTISSGQATFTTTTLAVGSHSITAIYNGSGTDLASTSSVLTEVVNGDPAAVSVSPTSGTGVKQTFTAVYTDPSGTSDLADVQLLVNAGVSAVNSCYVIYNPATNDLYLENNAGNGTAGPIQPGSSSTLTNGQCTLAGTGTSVSTSGNNMTVKYALTFASTFTGSKNVYLHISAKSGYNTGWVSEGQWVPVSLGNPAPVSVSPNIGTGLTETFTASYTDPNGSSDIKIGQILIDTAISAANSCYAYYTPANNGLYLENSAGTAVTGPIAPGSSGSLSNNDCTLSGAGTTVTTSGNNMTIKYALTFSSSFTGSQNVYLYANSYTGAVSGWVKEGQWVPASLGNPSPTSVSPSSGTGLTQTFFAKYYDPNGGSDFSLVQILFNTGISAANGCFAYYQPGNNGLYLYNDAGTAALGPITPGSSATLSNSACTLSAAGSSATQSGVGFGVYFALTFSNSFTGSKNVYLHASSYTGVSTNWVQKGTWTP